MKNLTRILALVLVFTMMISTAAFAATFTDVEDGSTYAEATKVLSALGIINGYEDGTFKPDAVITRAEVVAVVNRLQGLSDAAKAASGTSMYTDVPATEWYAGDVNLASQMGIVSGDGNGLFRPNDQVKYEEAVKMMVASLGYNQEYVLKQGGWPTGYLVIATDKGVTKGLSVSAGEPAYRGIVAKLAYQSLSAPMMVLKSYDDDGKATYASDDTKTLLGTKLGYAKLVGYVNANDVSSLTSNTALDAGYITYKFDNTSFVTSSTSTQNGYKYYVGNTDVADFNGSGITEKIAVSDTDVAATLGYATEIYIANDDDKDEPKVLTYITSTKNNSTVAIEDSSIIMSNGAAKYPSTVVSGANGLTGVISVYDDDVDNTNTEYTLDGANLIFNGEWVASSNFNAPIGGALGTYMIPTQGNVQLLDNDGDGKYEFVFVTSYETRVVDSVFSSNKKIGMKSGSTLDMTNFVDEKDGYTYSITLDGKAINVADLQEFDVLSIAQTVGGKNVEIIVSRNVVDGSVEAIDSSSNALDTIYTVAGQEYNIANLANTSDYPSLSTSSEGKFYIDSFGKIAYLDGASSTITGSLAFVEEIGSFTSMGKTDYEMKVLNKDGSVVVYNFADDVTIKVADVNKQIAAGTTNLVNSTAKSAKADVYAYINNLVTATANAGNYAKRVITYKANASSKITNITFAAAAADSGMNYVAGASAGEKYDASVSAFDTYGITDSTVVFYLPTAKTIDDYEIATSGMFIDDKTYSIAYMDIDDDNNAGVVVITSDSKSIADNSSLAIVTGSVIATNEDGDKVIKVTFLQDGEEKTLMLDDEATINDVDNNPFAKGSIFEYSVNAAGEMDDAAFCGHNMINALPSAVAMTWNTVKANIGNFPTTRTTNTDYFYVGGYVVAKNGSTLTLANNFYVENGNRISVPSSANIYYVDVTKTKIAPAVAAIGDIVACKYYDEDTNNDGSIQSNEHFAEEDQNTYVVMKYVDKTIVDVIVYYGFDI